MGKEIINIKGTRKGLVILVDSNKDFDELKANLKEKIASSKGFFKGAKFTFHIDNNLLSLDKEKELEEICRQHGLIPSEEKITLAKGTPKVKKKAEGVETNSEASAVTKEAFTSTTEEENLLLTAGLRSGQKVNCTGTVTVLGDVNHGSEIIAAGDIVVMGTLRGVVHAGATGNDKAVIVAYRLEATQIRISDKIGRAPEESFATTVEPEIAYIANGQIEVNKYIPNKLKLG